MSRVAAGTYGCVAELLLFVPVLAHAGHTLAEAALFAPPAVLVVTATVRSLRAQHQDKRTHGGNRHDG